ncbi:MAG: peptidylprolyl isomerase [Alicyclobacillus sp.]|nr:peptidylprolyl isomerase [Alicyclobacillus sp.]
MNGTNGTNAANGINALNNTANNVTGNGAGAMDTSGKPQWSSPPAMQIDPDKQYQAVVHTNYGDFTIQLFAKDTPHTVNNFVFLARHQFYNGLKFFRIIKTFMIQTGSPNNDGTGGPGYEFADELPPKYPYAPGIVAMANAGPNTNGSQFFICTGADSAGLNQQPAYTEFGKVVSGMKVVEKIAAIPVKMNPMSGEVSLPTKNAYIESIDISEK